MIILFEPEAGVTVSQETVFEEPALLEATLTVHKTLEVIPKVSAQALLVAIVMLFLETLR